MGVKLGSGVKVFRGVGVNVAVGVDGGIAANVCIDAASAVCPINKLTSFGSSGGIGVGLGIAGTHPLSNVKIMNQISSFGLDAAMFLSHIQAYSCLMIQRSLSPVQLPHSLNEP
jgi:hypothetical protein